MVAELHATIDEIPNRAALWEIYTLKYLGPLPDNPPAWMLQEYELNTRNIVRLLEAQISNPAFDGHFDYQPYVETNRKTGEWIFSNVMSGEWVSMEAVSVSRFQPFLGLSDYFDF